MILKYDGGSIHYTDGKTHIWIDPQGMAGSLKGWGVNAVLNPMDASSKHYKSVQASPHRVDK